MKTMQLTTFAFLAGLLACAPVEQRDDGPEDALNAAGLATYLAAASGDCVQMIRAGDNLGRLSCTRTPPSNCAVDRIIDLGGNAIVTVETEQRYTNAWARITDTYPFCQVTAATAVQTGIFTATTDDAIKNLNESVYRVVNNCDTLRNENTTPLVSETEHEFLISPRGVLATQAWALSQNFVNNDPEDGTEDPAIDCYLALTFFEWERTLIQAVSNTERVNQTLCLYGSTAAGNFPCSEQERLILHPFDFDPTTL